MNPISLVVETYKAIEEVGGYWFPQHVADRFGVSWNEAALALWVLKEMGKIGKRRDGRFYLIQEEKSDGKPQDEPKTAESL